MYFVVYGYCGVLWKNIAFKYYHQIKCVFSFSLSLSSFSYTLRYILLVQVLNSAKRPIVLVGSVMLQRPDAAAIHAAVSTLAENTRQAVGCGDDWRVLNVLHRVSTRYFISLLQYTVM